MCNSRTSTRPNNKLALPVSVAVIAPRLSFIKWKSRYWSDERLGEGLGTRIQYSCAYFNVYELFQVITTPQIYKGMIAERLLILLTTAVILFYLFILFYFGSTIHSTTLSTDTLASTTHRYTLWL